MAWGRPQAQTHVVQAGGGVGGRRAGERRQLRLRDRLELGERTGEGEGEAKVEGARSEPPDASRSDRRSTIVAHGACRRLPADSSRPRSRARFPSDGEPTAKRPDKARFLSFT